MATLVASPGTAEWHAARREGIGASEAAAALGLSSWKTAAELYQDKVVGSNFSGNAATRFGKAVEPVIAEMFQDDCGLALAESEPGLFRSDVPELEWMLATPDGLLTNVGQLAEWKSTAYTDALGPEGTDQVPMEWLIQAQHQLAVMDAQVVHFGVLVLTERRVRHYVVQRDDDLINQMIEGEAEIWARIQDRNPPDLDWSHPSTVDLVRSMYPEVDPAKRVSLSDTAAAHWATIESMHGLIKRVSEQRDQLRARVLAEVGDAAEGVFPGGEYMIRRRLVEREPYTVTPKPYVDCRKVKVPKPKKGKK